MPAYPASNVPKESCPARGTWIEMTSDKLGKGFDQSCPARGTWIEIMEVSRAGKSWNVVPRKGHVD